MILNIWEKVQSCYSFNGKDFPMISLDVRDLAVHFDIIDVFQDEKTSILLENTVSARANRIRENMMESNPNLIHISIKSICRINEQS